MDCATVWISTVGRHKLNRYFSLMNTLSALKREQGILSKSETITEPRHESAANTKTESSPLIVPRPAPKATTIPVEMLSRVQGVARWGLNE